MCPPLAELELSAPAAANVAPPPAGADAFARLEARWSELAQRWLPVAVEGSIWRHSATPIEHLPPQGWKLHVSATILSAADVLAAIAPLLTGRGVAFKSTASLLELKRLNIGLFYGYSQIGKAFTIYPRNDAEAAELAPLLDEATSAFDGVTVPFEDPVRRGSSVFARFGAFRAGAAGASTTLTAPTGEAEPDSRIRNPAWAVRPPALGSDKPARSRPGPLATRYRAYEAISQRGKGGVYRAIDLTATPLRLCIVKEGRRNGEVDLDRSDGRRRIRREADVLVDLAAAGVPVPAVHAQFAGAGNRYLVLECMEGETLAARLGEDREPLSVGEALRLAHEAAVLIAQVHAGGWVWRDVKPGNFMLAPAGTLRPIDFEGAARVGSGLGSPWGTAGYLPPEWRELTHADASQDVYALGAIIHQLFTRRIPTPDFEFPMIRSSRPEVPAEIDTLVAAMTAREPSRRPRAEWVVRELDGEAAAQSLSW